jgi:hypothetical protein
VIMKRGAVNQTRRVVETIRIWQAVFLVAFVGGMVGLSACGGDPSPIRSTPYCVSYIDGGGGYFGFYRVIETDGKWKLDEVEYPFDPEVVSPELFPQC